MKESELTEIIIGCAIEVHRTLGPGLLESAYQTCLIYELELKGLKIEKEKRLPLIYKTIQLEQGYRIDILVENKIVIELKTVEALHEAHEAQILTYLKLGHYPVGLLFNFNAKYLKYGMKRYVM